MTDNIKLPPMPKPHTPPVFATAANTPSVKAGYELGGYEKTPPLFDEHQLEAYAREAVRLNAQAVPDALEKELLQAIQERDAADDYIDALLDEVLGTDRPEWSSVYGHAEAMEQVRETMGALMKPSIDKAWDRFQSAQAAPAAPQPAQPLDAGVMELAESVGLIGPSSRTHDLHEAIQRFHDLIVVNASIKAALNFADSLAQPAQQTCNCRWVDDVQVQQCTLHQAHVEAIHEWAERAKAAEAKIKAQQPLTDDKDALLRQALEALENGARVRNAEGGTKYQPPIEEAAIEAIRNHLGVKP